MIISFDQVFDIAADISVIFLAAFLYRELVSVGRSKQVGDVLAGVVFGAVTLETMVHPITAVDGLVLDLRSVPLALAGAYLGWRGILACMAIAVCTRLGLGGVGMWAGALSIVLSLGLGASWARLTNPAARRGVTCVMMLGVVSALNYVSILLLPPKELAWFASNALLPLVLVTVALVPLAALVVEYHREKMRVEENNREPALRDRKTGLLTLDAFRNELETCATASADLHIRQVLLVRIRHLPWLRAWHAQSDLTQVLGAMRVRIEQAVPGIGPIGFVAPDVLLVPLKLQQLLEWEAVIASVRRCLTETPFQRGDGAPCGVNLDFKMVKPDQVISHPDVTSLVNPLQDWLFEKPKSRLGRFIKSRMLERKANASGVVPNEECDRVFKKLRILLDEDQVSADRNHVA